MHLLRSMAVFAVGLLVIPFCGAQAPAAAASTPEATVLQINSNLVQLDVVVTNKDKAVHDLPRGRFHIFEDGHEQLITSFDEHRLAEGEVAVPPSIAPLPPDTYTNVTQYPQVGAVNVMLLDGLNTPVVNQADVRRQMIEYVGTMRPGTSVAIFALGTQLEMLQGFTTDGAQLARVLEGAKTIAHPSTVMDNGMAQQLRDTGTVNDQNNPGTKAGAIQTGTATGASQFSSFMNQFAADITTQLADQQVRITLGAFQQLARYLSAIPGRKNLIWFSGSFPIEVAPDSSLNQAFQDMRNWESEVREASKLLLVSRVAVYPVYALGPQSLPSLQASYSTVSDAGFGPPPMLADDARGTQAIQAKQGTMVQIAHQTGGQYFNTNGLKEAMESAVDNGANYYTIGYIPTSAQLNGKFRNIKVSLDNANFNLAYRRGYYADPPDKKEIDHPGEANMVTASAVLGAPQATEVQFQARVLPAIDPQLQGIKLPEGSGGEMTASLKGAVQRYIVEVTVDPHNLTFEQTPDGSYRTEVDYVLSAYGADTKRVNYVDHGIKLNLKPDQYARIMDKDNSHRLPPHRMAIDLPAGQIVLRIVVYDPAASHAGSLEIPLKVAANQALAN